MERTVLTQEGPREECRLFSEGTEVSSIRTHVSMSLMYLEGVLVVVAEALGCQGFFNSLDQMVIFEVDGNKLEPEERAHTGRFFTLMSRLYW